VVDKSPPGGQPPKSVTKAFDYLKADNVWVRFLDFVQDPWRSVLEVEVDMPHVLEHKVLWIAVGQDIIGKDLDKKFALSLLTKQGKWVRVYSKVKSMLETPYLVS
jgi:hypothetical protein